MYLVQILFTFPFCPITSFIVFLKSYFYNHKNDFEWRSDLFPLFLKVGLINKKYNNEKNQINDKDKNLFKIPICKAFDSIDLTYT